MRIIQPDMKTNRRSPDRPRAGHALPDGQRGSGSLSRRHFLTAAASAGAAGAGLSAYAFGPGAARPAEAIVRAYVRESFGGLAAAEGEDVRLRELLEEFRGAVRGLRAR